MSMIHAISMQVVLVSPSLLVEYTQTMLNITTALQVNLRFNFQPACIAYPTLEQVSDTVLAGHKNLKIAPRSGGVRFSHRDRTLTLLKPL